MTTDSTHATADLEARVQRIRELSARAIELSQQNGRAWIDAYEKLLEGFLQMQQQAASATQIDWVNNLVQANADMIREVSRAYFGAMRDQLK